jgi:hypothetical protein
MKKICTTLFLMDIFLKSLTAQVPTDTVFTLKNDTLVCKITLNKEKNKFFMTTDSSEKVLNPADIVSFVTNSKEDDYDRKEYFTLFGNFYTLEFGKNAPITVYTKVTYKTTEELGQKYFTAKKDYCFFKNNTPYFYRAENHRETMLILIQDCPIVTINFQNKHYKNTDPIPIILDYNNCGVTTKK